MDFSSVGWIAGIGAIAGVVVASVIFKKDLQHFLQDFTNSVEGMGVFGYFSYSGFC